MKWSKTVWQQSERIYNAILCQPFIRELADGTLSADRFERYIAQDEVYIGNYGRQMFQLADRIGDASEQQMFRLFAQSGIDSEHAMHQLLIERFGIDTAVAPSSITSAYNAHSQEAVDRCTAEEALAALLPCMWIYNRVGLHILSIAHLEDNPYREWIEEYGNEEFTQGVQSVVELADRWADAVTPATRDAMTRQYLQAALYEYAFWDYGYHGDTKDYTYTQRLETWL